jgi:aryl-alcohol dehydrogenase-like predicted oxidoreductase
MPKTQLKTAQLGTTGLEITRIGFGAWAIGGGGWEAVDAAIGGFRRPDQVAPILTAAGIVVSAEDVEQIERGER